MKALVGAFNQEKALVGAFSVIVKTGCGTDGALHSTTFVCFWSWYLGTVAREDKKLTWNYVQRDKWSPAWVGWARARQARDPAHCHCTCPVSTLFGHANYEKGDQKCIILQPSDFLLLFFRFVDHDIHLQSLPNRSPFTLIRKYALISQRCLQNH